MRIRNVLITNEARLLLAYRAAAGKRQFDVAREAGLSQPIYSAIERGERRPATRAIARRIANALSVPLEMIFPEFAEAEDTSNVG